LYLGEFCWVLQNALLFPLPGYLSDGFWHRNEPKLTRGGCWSRGFLPAGRWASTCARRVEGGGRQGPRRHHSSSTAVQYQGPAAHERQIYSAKLCPVRGVANGKKMSELHEHRAPVDSKATAEWAIGLPEAKEVMYGHPRGLTNHHLHRRPGCLLRPSAQAQGAFGGSRKR